MFMYIYMRMTRWNQWYAEDITTGILFVTLYLIPEKFIPSMENIVFYC
jgi:hypothetical protein